MVWLSGYAKKSQLPEWHYGICP
ncbi:protein of unknown function [Denitratisoma oestradiolicum]|uniref:Uncharacterized protein n=1 Tax=Denitratisoma oestradiolicum TaxID=311182 RepID=A0A6S6Y2U2_9PROT|nr:protein of unknown function [Denitratisoma oestradiolicum]